MHKFNLSKGLQARLADRANARFHSIIWIGCTCVIALISTLTYIQG